MALPPALLAELQSRGILPAPAPAGSPVPPDVLAYAQGLAAEPPAPPPAAHAPAPFGPTAPAAPPPSIASAALQPGAAPRPYALAPDAGAPAPIPPAGGPGGGVEGVFAAPPSKDAGSLPLNLPPSVGMGAPTAPQSVSRVSPTTRAMVEGAGKDKLAAADLGQMADMTNADMQAQAMQQQADTLAAQQAQMQAQEDARRKAYDAQKADYDRIARDASEGKIHPQHVGMMGTIGIALGALGSGLTHSPNFAVESINKRIDQDIDAQRANLESKHHAVSEAGQGLDEMRRRFGDDRMAETAERARQLAQAKATGDTMVARSQSPMLAAKWQGIKAGIEAEQAEAHAKMEQWVPGGAGVGGAAVNKLAEDLLKSGRYANPDDALNAAARLVTQGKYGTNQNSVAPGGGKGNARVARRQAELDQADQAAQRLEGLLRNGSSLSMSQRAQAEADANVVRRAGFTNVAEKPLEVFSSSSARGAGVSEARRLIQEERNSLAKHMAPGGGGGGEEEPEGDADADITPAGR